MPTSPLHLPRWALLLALMLVLWGALPLTHVDAQDDCSAYTAPALSPLVIAPDFPAELDWVNVSAPLSLEDLRGKIVLLDFWTYGCINCIHMIPTLERLEEKYSDELVVIGVHSAKFDNEGQTDNIREIVQRYGVKHPVINDSDFIVWELYSRFGVAAWPTFVVINPRGEVFAAQAGEIPFAAFDGVVGAMSTCFDIEGLLVREPLAQIAPELADAPPRALNYPSKVLADADGERLFIADSANHRIVIADLNTYEVLDVIGTGQQGFLDGTYESASFYKPYGMALRDDTLYIADTFNHTLRAADLSARTVTTLAGTGLMGRGNYGDGRALPAAATDLRSPWALEFADDGLLYVAMAGTHQIWAFDLETGIMRYAVGNGREAQINRSLLTSELAQPSGLYFRDGLLFFADSESSTVRVADLNADSVAVVSGTTNNSLFDYGDVDGVLGESRLQHPLDMVSDGAGTLYIADTYNSKIKAVDLNQPNYPTETVFGAAAGFADGAGTAALFNEPGGMDYADGRLFIADTNNHAIRVIDLSTGEVSTVTFPNPQALRINGAATVIGGNEFRGAERLPAQTVSAGMGEITLTLALPEGYKLNDLAPSQARFGGGALLALSESRVTLTEPTLALPVTFSAGEDTLSAAVELYYCEAVNETLCFIERFVVEIPLVIADDAETNAVSITREIVPPALPSVGGIGG